MSTQHEGRPPAKETPLNLHSTTEASLRHGPDDEQEMRSDLRKLLTETAEKHGLSMGDLTVLDHKNDPFRVDTPAKHRDGRWLATQRSELGLNGRTIHLRGLHYALIDRPKPDGTPYTNTAKDWEWLSGDAAKAARWLGYIPFDDIVDQRNAAPVIKTFAPPQPRPMISTGVWVDIPEADDFVPEVYAEDFKGVQPYKIVMFGEKSSLADVLEPLARTYGADLYLPTGEISDTQMHMMAKTGADDGRPMVVLCFSDCDPSGWQMPVSISRKLQAFKASLYPELEFQVRRVALTPDMVRQLGLPSTVIKETEKRAGKWKAAMGVEQTEIDALVTLRPDVLREIARNAIEEFYDSSLDLRVFEARDRWLREAQAALAEQLDGERIDQLRADAAVRLAAIRDEIDAINQAMRVDAGAFTLPPIEVPTASIDPTADGVGGLPPLLDSRWDFAEQCRRLIASKAYETGEQ